MRLAVEQKQIQSQVPSQQMQQALLLLRKNAWELNEYLREQALENPLLEIREPEWRQWSASPAQGAGALPYERAVRRTLRDELLEQLDVRRLSGAEQKAAKEIIAALDERGYFTESLRDLERVCGVTRGEAIRALKAVQDLDPAGVGARNLSECLTLQLKRLGVTDEAPYVIAKEHLALLAEKKYARIAKAVGITTEKSREYGALIASLRPGADNAPQDDTVYVYPEIAVENDGGMLKVYIDEKKLVRASLSQEYDAGELDKEAQAYLRERSAAAKRIVSSLDLWKTMLMRVAEEVIHTQRHFFLDQAALVPLRMSDVASTLGVHVSTVSRAVAGKYVLYEGRSFPLKSFFSRGVAEAETISGDAARRCLKELLEKEPGLSDSALSQKLNERGVPVARRTVAKYRKEMGIASSYRRKKD